MRSRIAITGIHTGIGKTIASAVIAEALGADYWKPVQAGNLDSSDSIMLRTLLSNGDRRVHQEAVVLTEPMSPHAAAHIDKVSIDHTKFTFPQTDKTLIIETAGGLLSPISDNATMADFLQYYQLPTFLVSNNYLGSINHTLLTIEVLKNRGINILGLIMNGEENKASEAFIEQYGNTAIIARIPIFEALNHETIAHCATAVKGYLLEKTGYGENH